MGTKRRCTRELTMDPRTRSACCTFGYTVLMSSSITNCKRNTEIPHLITRDKKAQRTLYQIKSKLSPSFWNKLKKEINASISVQPSTPETPVSVFNRARVCNVDTFPPKTRSLQHASNGWKFLALHTCKTFSCCQGLPNLQKYPHDTT